MIKKVFFVLIIVYIEFNNAAQYPRYFPRIKSTSTNNEKVTSEALFLTPLIEQGKIQEAQNASKTILEDILSYSGFLTVNKEYNSNLFFWFFPSQNDFKNDPVLLWLQGGPGSSSLFGLFFENGPYFVKNKDCLQLREDSWNKNHSVIYIDNPVGTGFSFTDNDNGYATTEEDVASNLYNSLLQFFQLFPTLQNNSFYITGESYAGKYVPAIAYKIHKSNPTARQKINLEGIAVGNGIFERKSQLDFGQYFYQIGLIDSNQYQTGKGIENQILQLIQEEKWNQSHILYDQLWDHYSKASGFNSFINYLHSESYFNSNVVGDFLQRSDIRTAIHVGNQPYIDGSDIVYTKLYLDSMQSGAPWISELLSNYRVLFYNGQLDLTLPYPLMVNFLQHLNFSGANEYKTAPRLKWYVEKDLAGYIKVAGNLTEVLIRNAGHLAPTDQPKWSLDLIFKFVRNKMFDIYSDNNFIFPL